MFCRWRTRGNLTQVERDGLARTILAVLDATPGVHAVYRGIETAPPDQGKRDGWCVRATCGSRDEKAFGVNWQLEDPKSGQARKTGQVTIQRHKYLALIQSQREAAKKIIGEIAGPLGLPGTVLSEPQDKPELSPALRGMMDRFDERSLISVIRSGSSRPPSPAHHLAIAEAYCWLSWYLRGGPSDLTYAYAARAVGHYNAAVLRGADATAADIVMSLLLLTMHHAAEANGVIEAVMKKGVDKPKVRCLAGLIRSDPRYSANRASGEPQSIEANLWAAMTFERSGALQAAASWHERVEPLNPQFMFVIMHHGMHATVGGMRQCTDLALSGILQRDLQYFLTRDWLPEATQKEALNRLGSAVRAAGMISPQESVPASLRRILGTPEHFEYLVREVEPYQWVIEQVIAAAPAQPSERFSLRDYVEFSRAQFFDAVWNRFNLLAHMWGVREYAQEFADAFLAARANEALAFYLKGQVRELYDKRDEAEKWYDKAVRARPSIAVAAAVFGKLKRRPWGRVSRAVSTEARHDPSLVLTMVDCVPAIGKDSEGVGKLSRSLEIDPFLSGTYYQLLNRTDDEKYLDKGLAAVPHSNNMLLTAGWRLRNSDPDRAIACLRQCLELDPRQAQAYTYIGTVLSNQKKYEEAIAEWRKYLEIDADSLRAVHMMNRIGNAYLTIDKLDEALKVYEVAAQSWQGGAMIGLGRTYERLGRLEEAEQWYVWEAKRYPQNGPSYLLAFYARVGWVADAEKVMRDIPKESRGYSFRAKLVSMYLINNMPDKVIEFYDKVCRRRDSRIFAHIGAAKYAMGKWSEAAESFRQAFRASGRNWYGFWLYFALVETGEIEGALKAVKESQEKGTRRNTRDATTRAMHDYLLDKISQTEWLKAAEEGLADGIAHQYVAVRSIARGDMEAAKLYLIHAVRHAKDGLSVAHGLARARLRLMGVEPPAAVSTVTPEAKAQWAEEIRQLNEREAQRWKQRTEHAKRAFAEAMKTDGLASAAVGDKIKAWRQYLDDFGIVGDETTKARERLLHWLRLEKDGYLPGPVSEKLQKKVTLTRDKLSLQFAVHSLAEQIGLKFDRRVSADNVAAMCQQQVSPKIADQPCRDALRELLSPLGLDYVIIDGKVVLVKVPSAKAEAQKPKAPK